MFDNIIKMKNSDKMAAKELYTAFLKAIKENKGKIVNTNINGVDAKVYLLNTTTSRVVLDLNDLSIYQVKTISGRKLIFNKLANTDDLNKKNIKEDNLKKALKNLGKQFSDDMKGSFLEKLQAMRAIKHKTLAKTKIRKTIVKRATLKRSVAK